MIVEHIGFTVSAPKEMAKWYVENLGFIIQFEGGDEKNGMVFVSDENRSTMLELIKSPGVSAASEIIQNNSQLHIALKSENPIEDRKRLEAAGATFVGQTTVKNSKDILLMIKDPWGNYLQLAKREDENKFNK